MSATAEIWQFAAYTSTFRHGKRMHLPLK
jgi:hypothetical protein